MRLALEGQEAADMCNTVAKLDELERGSAPKLRATDCPRRAPQSQSHGGFLACGLLKGGGLGEFSDPALLFLLPAFH